MQAERLLQHLPHAHARIERGVGILEDHLDAAIDAGQPAGLQSQDRIAADRRCRRPSARPAATMQRATVDLPEPLSPTSASVSPALISRSTPSTATKRRPPSTGKVFLRLRTCRSGRLRTGSSSIRRPRPAGSPTAGAGCSRRSGRVKIASALPVSTTRPAFITTTSWQVSATTPRSCVIRQVVEPARAAELDDQLHDVGLDGDVEAGRRLVEDQERRPADQRGHGDHRALRHAAGEFVRILPRPALRLGNGDARQRLDRPASSRRAGCRRAGAARHRRAGGRR